MQSKKLRILVLFVEPMLYGMDLIHEVYEKTSYQFQYIYCDEKLTGKDELILPEHSVVCSGGTNERKAQVTRIFNEFQPHFAVINGYVGTEQKTAIKFCQKHKIPYAIESDTPLHIPESKLRAVAKKIYLRTLLGNKYCYGFPGGSLQKENLVYYGIPEDKCFIMPMSVSEQRLLEEKERIPDQNELKKKYGLFGKRVFLFVGRLEAVKNVSLLLKAFGELKKTNPDTALLIVGDGSEIDSLKGIVTDKQIPDVYFMGYVVFPRIIEFYKVADVFVLPSTYEPWGLVVNEAMIMGLPVIASSDVGCRKDLIIDGQNGFVFESSQEAALVEKMKLLCENDLGRYSDQAVERLKEWNYKFYLDCFIDAINYAKWR